MPKQLINITGLISQGSNITITGSGTTASPYVVSASGGGGTTYTAGTGIDITSGVISNTITNNSQLTNGAGYITASSTSFLTNKILSNGTWWGTDGSNLLGSLGATSVSTDNYGNLMLKNTANAFSANLYSAPLTATRLITLPNKDGTIALTSDIPTNNNQLTNGAGYVTSSALSSYLALAGGTMTGGINLAGGTSTVPPLKFSTGTGSLLLTPTQGSVEIDGNGFPYYTYAASTRCLTDTEQFITLMANYTLPNATAGTFVALFNSPANGAVTLTANTTYFFECLFSVSGMSSTSGSFGFALGGTANISACHWSSIALKATSLTTPAAPQTTNQINTFNTVIVTASTGTAGFAIIKGKIIVTTGGTLIPQICCSVNNGLGTARAGSYFRIWTVGTNNVTQVGNWS